MAFTRRRSMIVTALLVAAPKSIENLTVWKVMRARVAMSDSLKTSQPFALIEEHVYAVGLSSKRR